MIDWRHPKDPKLLIFVGVFALVVLIVGAGGYWLHTGLGSAGKLADSADPEDRIRAAAQLASKDSPAARKALRRLSRDSNRYVAIRAVWTIGERRTRASRDLLGEIARDRGAHSAARHEAAAALGKFKDADPGILTELLTVEADAEVRAGAAKGLLRMRNPKTLPELVRALEDPDRRVRLWAITAIHKMIARRFPYDAKLPPDKQRHEIERIKAYLRKAGVL